MDLRSQIESDLSQAMRANDEVRKSTLRMALSAIKLAEIEKGRPLNEAESLSILHKEIKSRGESIADAETAGRPDLIERAEAEQTVLEGYLPEPLSQAELEEAARQAINEVGATSLREMGQVMKVLLPRLQGRVDAAQASQVVRGLLA